MFLLGLNYYDDNEKITVQLWGGGVLGDKAYQILLADVLVNKLLRSIHKHWPHPIPCLF